MDRILVYIVIVAAALAGCDGLVDEIDEERAITGRYVAADSLVLRFLPAAAYDEQNETPYLPDSSFSLLENGGRMELSLSPDSRNKGTARVELIVPDSLFLDADSTYLLVPDTTMIFDGEYITVIDRVILRSPSISDEEVPPTPIPLRWQVRPRGRLLGQQQLAVVRPVTRFDTQRGRYVTREENLGTLHVGVAVAKQ